MHDGRHWGVLTLDEGSPTSTCFTKETLLTLLSTSTYHPSLCRPFSFTLALQTQRPKSPSPFSPANKLQFLPLSLRSPPRPRRVCIQI